MLAPNKSHAEVTGDEPLVRTRLIKFLEDRGVNEIEGQPLEECYTFKLIKVANYWKSSEFGSLIEAV
jgi:hypothetical protein